MRPKEKRYKSYKYGRYSESVVALYLRLKGYKILLRNFKISVGEIDIIAKRGAIIVFIEVKARKKYCDEVLRPSQQRRICNAASIFVANNPLFTDYQLRFDLIQVQPWSLPLHIKNAWYCS